LPSEATAFSPGALAEKRAQLDTLAKEKRLPVETLEMDVCDDRSVERAVAVVHQKTGKVDVLINKRDWPMWPPSKT